MVGAIAALRFKMIVYLEGTLFKLEEERAVVLTNQVGYEVLLPALVSARLRDKAKGDPVAFHIYFYQTERQPKPALIGFLEEQDKEFFQHFITVEDIGPMKAMKALTMPVGEIALAIENGDLKMLGQLKGIGTRTAQKIVATLKGKVSAFMVFEATATVDAARLEAAGNETTVLQVLDVLVNQLGYKALDARYMINQAYNRKPDIATPEELFDEVFLGENEAP